MAGQRRERSDAAANRRRILDSARRLLAERGAEALTMQAVASAAGVGKGTVFHRFGDRDGLIAALVTEYMGDFQERFLHGPPPLGPGAEPGERLEAFMSELLAVQVERLELALVAERMASDPLPPAYLTLLLHVAGLLAEIDPQIDAEVTAGYLLGAVGAPILRRVRAVASPTSRRCSAPSSRSYADSSSQPPRRRGPRRVGAEAVGRRHRIGARHRTGATASRLAAGPHGSPRDPARAVRNWSAVTP